MEQRTPKPGMVWAGTQAKQDCAAQGRAGAIRGGSAGLPMWVRIRRTGAVSVMKAMMRMSAPQRGQTSGRVRNRQAMSRAHG